MGQKVNPHGLRVGVIKDWDSRWYASDEKVGDLIVEDQKIRKYLKKTLYGAGVLMGVLTESGIEHEHLVNFSVAVPVVVGIIYICICCQYCLSDHLSWLGVVGITLVGAVIPTLVGKHVWTYNIELDIELAETLRAEIICNATSEA